MDAIHSARCLVVGAGALGNEVTKNLILSGFRDITIVDMDSVTGSNLNRCLFFRDSDVGSAKSDVIAERASDIDPSVSIRPLRMSIQDLQEWDHDIVLGCVDNISARLHVNAHCRFHSIPYVDGATDGFRGKVQVVLDGTCLQCTMNRSHMRIIDKRFSCTGDSTFTPKMAAEITTTSVISAMQVREALKIISGKEEMCIDTTAYYNGETGDMFILKADTDPNCPNHGG